ncbi:MAG: TonB-dependent receptor [Xanthomonadales bacterium]|nr:TonB-dependent receptor [Xanthomonadales bacterium]
MLTVGAACLSGTAPAHDNDVLEEVVVEGRKQVLVGEARSASEGVIGRDDLENRPLLRPGDVLESIPGLVVTQHSGSGKSNQMFLRGFNLDHGTDFATHIDGMPVNMRTHGHGQGYTDINFLIPETVQTIDYFKGPYFAELGDFSSAGGAFIDTFETLPENSIKLSIGENGRGRVLAMGSQRKGDLFFTGAVEGVRYDGPWTDIDEDVDKINGLFKMGSSDDISNWSVTAMFYDNTWNSADQIPSRAVRDGLISEFGSIDGTLGGASRRASLSANYEHEHEFHRSEWAGYVIDYRMQLWSNFTYLLDDPINGDQFQQLDDRTIFGGTWNRYWVRGEQDHFHHRLGMEVRHDDIGEVGLFHTSERQRRDTVRLDAVDQTSVGVFYELAWRLSQRWRTVLGIRGDRYWFDVRSDNELNSGDDSAGLISPKASLIYALSGTTELYASAGAGFHSNDARGTTISFDPVSGEAVGTVDALVRSTGAEIGFKTAWQERWNTNLALWVLELDSELLFVGDAGTTEPSRPSRRWGLDFNNYWQLNENWSVEADLSWAHARFTEDAPEGNHVPGAIETVVTAAITGEFDSGWFGSARLRYFGPYPLVEDNSVRSDGSTMVNLAAGWSGERWQFRLDVLNLLDANDHDVDYYFASRLAGEPTEGIEDIHYHVFEPRQVRVYVTLRF